MYDAAGWARPARALEFYAGIEGFGCLRGGGGDCKGRRRAGVGDAAAEVFVDGQGECGEQFGLGEEDDGVVAGVVSSSRRRSFAQVGRGHEVGVVDGEGNGFALAVEGVGLLNDLAFAFEVSALVFHGEGGAEDAQGVGVGVEGAGDVGGRRGGRRFGRRLCGGWFFAGAGRTGDDAEAALMASARGGVRGCLSEPREGGVRRG